LQSLGPSKISLSVKKILIQSENAASGSERPA
jgi:hypothetical protein